MAFDGLNRKHQLLRNLRVGGSSCQQLEHLQFACAQRVQQWLRRRVLSGSLMCRAILAKRSKHGVQIQSRPALALLLP